MTQINFTLANGGTVHSPIDNMAPVPVRTHAKTLVTGDPIIVIEDGHRQFSMNLSSAERLAQSILTSVSQIKEHAAS